MVALLQFSSRNIKSHQLKKAELYFYVEDPMFVRFPTDFRRKQLFSIFMTISVCPVSVYFKATFYQLELQVSLTHHCNLPNLYEHSPLLEIST